MIAQYREPGQFQTNLIIFLGKCQRDFYQKFPVRLSKTIALCAFGTGVRCRDPGAFEKSPGSPSKLLNSVIIQDIFELIYSSSIVIADLSRKNPNVFYEIGIAHTLGKPVIPIAQNIDDVPFDLRHHRVLTYYDNGEGRVALRNDLESRLITLKEDVLKNTK